MFCGSCGNKINDGDTFCGICGAKVREDYNLIISRPGTFAGFAVNLHIDVNGEKYELPAGGIISLKVAEGDYIVKYKIWCRREHEVVAKVEANKVATVIFEYDALWGGFKVSKNSNL